VHPPTAPTPPLPSLQVGAVVAVTGRVQANPLPDAPPHVLDVVVASLTVLHKNADALRTALRRAAAETGVAVATADALERLRRLGGAAYESAYVALPGGSGGDGAGGARRPAPGGGLRQAPSAGGAAAAAAKLPGPAGSSRAAAAPAPAPPAFWQLPVPLSEVVDVTDVAGLQAMRAAIFGGSDGSSSLGDSSSPGGGGGGGDDGVPPVVVGLDVEWRPFERGQPHTPAALLQVRFARPLGLAFSRRPPLATHSAASPIRHPPPPHPTALHPARSRCAAASSCSTCSPSAAARRCSATQRRRRRARPRARPRCAACWASSSPARAPSRWGSF
jgi:hypothetical protein